MQKIELMYDFGSPNAYLAHEALKGIAQRHGAEVVLLPVLIGGIFKASNNTAPMVAFSDIAGKIDYMHVEMARYLERNKVPFQFNPHFPVNSLNVMRAAVYAVGKSWEKEYVDTIYKAMWVDGLDMSNLDVVAEVLNQTNLPTNEIMKSMQDSDIKASLAKVTAAATSRKVYGLPSMFINGEMFFGKDSLNDLEWRLSQS